MEPEIDLIADLNAEEDEGLGWSALSDARDASQVRPGVMLVAAESPWPGGGPSCSSGRGSASAFHCAARLTGEEPSSRQPRPGLSASAGDTAGSNRSDLV
jgi:hypothetical protein